MQAPALLVCMSSELRQGFGCNGSVAGGQGSWVLRVLSGRLFDPPRRARCRACVPCSYPCWRRVTSGVSPGQPLPALCSGWALPQPEKHLGSEAWGCRQQLLPLGDCPPSCGGLLRRHAAGAGTICTPWSQVPIAPQIHYPMEFKWNLTALCVSESPQG